MAIYFVVVKRGITPFLLLDCLWAQGIHRVPAFQLEESLLLEVLEMISPITSLVTACYITSHTNAGTLK